MLKKTTVLLSTMGAASLLASCAATTTAISHRNLEVQSKMSDSIFLEPVSPTQRTVYINIRNTSDQPNFNIKQTIQRKMQAKGYRLEDDPNQAHYMLQANILSVEKMSPKEASNALTGGYGAVIGASTAALATNSGEATLAGGLIGGIVGSVADSMVKDVNYVVITDVQLSEASSADVQQRTQTHLKQGTSTTETQSSQETTHWKRYRTRIVGSADKVNLSFEEALPKLEEGLATSISGLL